MTNRLQPIFAVAVGLALGLVVTALAGENPLHVLAVLARGAFGTRYGLGLTLAYATPLVFTGLSVAVAFRAGLFNVGAEGQLTMGALAAAAVGAVWPGWGAPGAWLAAGTAAVAAGMAWGAVPGVLRAWRGSHEVINTIMLNFIAAGLANYVTMYVLRNPASQNPETRPVGPGYMLAPWAWFAGAPVGWGLPLAIGVAVAVGWWLERSVTGLELRALGENEPAARAAGINAGRVRVLAFALAGGLAGLVAVPEVLGNTGRFRPAFSAQYGFLGIAVALLGRNRPGGILAAALLFGALQKGATDLDMETDHVTRELALVFQALIILAVAAEGAWEMVFRRRARPC